MNYLDPYLYTVFGLSSDSTLYWGIIMTLAFLIIGGVILNQMLSDNLILKE